jgi:hypothetical protein
MSLYRNVSGLTSWIILSSSANVSWLTPGFACSGCGFTRRRK